MDDYAVLVVNGSIKDMDFYKDILDNAKIVVASDGAANILYRYSKDIDYIIGDLDSICEEVLNYYKNKDVTVKRYPVKKDKTDSEISIDEICKMGIEKIIMDNKVSQRTMEFNISELENKMVESVNEISADDIQLEWITH